MMSFLQVSYCFSICWNKINFFLNSIRPFLMFPVLLMKNDTVYAK